MRRVEPTDTAAPRTYDVHGLRLTASADSGALLDATTSTLEPFRSEGPADWRLAVRYGVPPGPEAEPEGMRLFWQGNLPGGPFLRYFTAERRREGHLPGHARLRLDLDGRKGSIVAACGSEHLLSYGCVTPALCEFLSCAGQYVLHAACLRAPDGDAGVLVCGPSGTGKTTTALALARAGMLLLTDDATFLTLSDGTVRAWGWPRPYKVHARTIELLPHLRALPRTPMGGGEFAIHPGPNSAVDEQVGPALLLLLRDRNPGGHRLEALPRLEALAELTRENLRAFDPLAAGPAGRQFAALAALVRQCAVYSLSAGPDVGSLGGIVRDLLRGNGT